MAIFTGDNNANTLAGGIDADTLNGLSTAGRAATR